MLILTTHSALISQLKAHSAYWPPDLYSSIAIKSRIFIQHFIHIDHFFPNSGKLLRKRAAYDILMSPKMPYAFLTDPNALGKKKYKYQPH